MLDMLIIFQKKNSTIGEPTSQAITNWDTTKGTTLSQSFPNDSTVFCNLQHSTLAKNFNEKRKNIHEVSYSHIIS